jgi:hypothetical protein
MELFRKEKNLPRPHPLLSGVGFSLGTAEGFFIG